MLSLALAATLVGFVLLIVGLITGSVWLAVACIVVCLIGLAFLIVDIIGSGRKDDQVGNDDQVGSDDQVDESDTGERPEGRRSRSVAAESDLSDDDPPDGGNVFDGGSGISGPSPAARRESPPQSSWQGVIQPGGRSGSSADAASNPDSGENPGTNAFGTGEAAQSSREGNYDDYLRAVGGDPATGGFRRPSTPDEQAPPQQGRPDQRPPAQGYQQPPRQAPPAQMPTQGPPPQGPAAPGYPQQPYPRGPYPQGREPYGQQRPGGDQQRPGAAPRQPEREQPPGIQQPPSDDGKPSDRPWEQPEREQGSGTGRFDPLDPNWRPPFD
ncbi:MULTISPECIES: hypothetical protein [unclassified Gordonia (in: high G+C Gram-positive bacteria)]|uniref:hypothetical protein n=1 Tax=unclassified Gordonia (in: high G+C Gram-positive bacteria) TaxID=2657482 RepID=UPI0007E946F5|nr:MULTISPECIES: hypothetical protein [unclassified Gordonia (in: high G+C Gram-positive bacteria)]OBA43857.1 hypothetical protein A5766_16495 [Gordonia sp. 852002-51296_SCH5728562-b]OBA62714.1 hypothetical protein A5777_23785 [Gordonia sp. 852002-10350_SCH5691597]